MSRVQDILASKSGPVQTTRADTLVIDAVGLMNKHKIGALVVTDDADRVVGIFTERDVLGRVVDERRDPAATRVGEVMSDQVVCAAEDMSVKDVQSIMMQRRIRHLPVVDAHDKLKGMISIGDVNAHFANGHQVELQYLHEYIQGRG